MPLVTILGSDTVAASRATINANFTYLDSLPGSGGIEGSAVLDFPAITDGDYSDLTFTVTGAVAGRPVSEGWPASLNPGILPRMWVSAADTVTVRLFNLSGATVNPASATYRVIVY